MDLERGRQLSRTPYSAVRRALSGSARLIANSVPYAAPAAANLFQRYLNSPPRTPNKRMRSRSRSVSRGRTMSRSGSSRTRSRSSSGWSSGRLITNQNDAASRYSRSGRRRGSGRAGRRFRYRVMQTVNANQPLSVYTVTGGANVTSAINAQNYWGVGLFSTKMTGQNDLENLFIDAGVPTATGANLSSSVVVKSCCLDVQIRNNGTADVVCDVYEILNTKDTQVSSNLTDLFAAYFGQMTTITLAAATNVAVSVFENPQFCKHFKVLNKKETTIPAGDMVTMQMRSGKDRRISGSAIVDYIGCIPKLSKFYFYMFHGIPEYTVTAPNARTSATDVVITYQKSYKYAIMSGRTTAQVHTA